MPSYGQTCGATLTVHCVFSNHRLFVCFTFVIAVHYEIEWVKDYALRAFWMSALDIIHYDFGPLCLAVMTSHHARSCTHPSKSSEVSCSHFFTYLHNHDKVFISDIYSGHFCLVFIGFCAICASFLASVDSDLGTGRWFFFCVFWFVLMFERHSYMGFMSSLYVNVK